MSKEPRWVVPFLRGLERTGEARAAARDAGIDHSTAYARRRAHGFFGEQWAEALAHHDARVRREEDEAIEALERDPPSPGSPLASPTSPASGRGEVVVSAGKVRRAGHGRWSKAKEAIFFDELAATSNIRMACDAVGISTNAILARRLKNRLFAAKFDAVVQSAKAVIDLHLVEETRKSFDPEDLDTGDVKPRVTIDQAIKISQIGASKRKADDPIPDPFAEQAAAMSEDDVRELRHKIVGKLRRMRERERRDQLETGWTYDESYDLMIPPGYVQGPDYRPEPPEEPIDFDDLYR